MIDHPPRVIIAPPPHPANTPTSFAFLPILRRPAPALHLPTPLRPARLQDRHHRRWPLHPYRARHAGSHHQADRGARIRGRYLLLPVGAELLRQQRPPLRGGELEVQEPLPDALEVVTS